MSQHKAQISGWGNFPVANCIVSRPERMRSIESIQKPMIARGLGKSYGDASLNTDRSVVLMERLNRFVDFDPRTGVLCAEAGCTLAEILQVFVPRGWFLPVTPGTKFVTLGGCLAADVHGKNHHRDGAFSEYVTEFELVLANGVRKRCSRETDKALFWATIGGMGLTGVITTITFQLMPISSAYVEVVHHQTKNLEATLDVLDDPLLDDKYSVAWMDCLSDGEGLGRGIVMNGHHVDAGRLSKKIKDPLVLPKQKMHTIPFDFPSFTLNAYSMKAFNQLYYYFQGQKTEPFIIDYEKYFYPLDTLHQWNRIYGKKGFLQYQFVVPIETGRSALNSIFQKIVAHRCSSFLAVLKKFGPQNEGYLSFPSKGYTLALDIPIKDSSIFPFLETIDRIVLENGGKVYLAKDARLSRENFLSMYPCFEEWHQIKSSVDPKCHYQSDLYRRLMQGGS